MFLTVNKEEVLFVLLDELSVLSTKEAAEEAMKDIMFSNFY